MNKSIYEAAAIDIVDEDGHGINVWCCVDVHHYNHETFTTCNDCNDWYLIITL